MAYDYYVKDPDTVDDIPIDWSDYLTEKSDTISSSSWIVPTGITLDSDTETTTGTTAWLSGGTLGCEYVCVNRIVTVGGRTQDKTIVVKIGEK